MAIAAPSARIDAISPPFAKVRTRLSAVGRRARAAVGAARLNASPALTASGLASIDAAMFLHGWFAGLFAVGISFFLYDWSREKT